ncbi:MAG: DUF4132 domain-containing protein [Janthinobacterium lividum]
MPDSESLILPPLPPAASPESREMQPVLQQLVQEAGAGFNWNMAITTLPTYLAARAQDAAYRGRLALAAAVALRANSGLPRTIFMRLLESLMRTTIALPDEQLVQLFQSYGLNFDTPSTNTIRNALGAFPVGLTLGQVEKSIKKHGLSAPLAAYLTAFLAGTHRELTGWQAADISKMQPRLQALLNLGDAAARPLVAFPEGDAFGRALTQFAASLPDGDPATLPWLRLLQVWQKTSGGQPTAKFRKELAAATAAVGAAAVREQGHAWLALLAATPVAEETNTVNYPEGRTYTYTSYTYLLEPNVAVAKGLIWTLQPLADAHILQELSTLAAKCYRKIPGKGPLAVGLGNACLLALSQNGLPGVAALARVRPKIKQTNTQALIAGYIEKASQQLGVSPDEIEDIAVPDFDLRDGRAEWVLGDYTATLALAGGKAEVRWAKAGKPLKAAPAALKSTHAAVLKDLKNAQTQAQQTFVAQRERLDRSFVAGRRIAAPWFRQYYAGHGLLSLLAHQLVWRVHHPDRTHTDAIWLANAWRDATHQPVAPPTDGDAIELWHPVLATTAEVLAWRALLEARQVQQPLKQAFREVYLLTPPEERTRTYSNRMAAHVLKQHQFSSLAKLRGWKYSLLGAYDKGYESETASLPLPAHGLRAEFWVSEVNADNEWNDTGIWHYVSTDQVRFVRGLDEVLPLPEVPPLTFSEVMRDVDLFVGVASVGNDPQWRDNGGLAQYRNYWETYSFGELGEVAKNRKLVLERLVPRLKIGKVSEIRDRFLVVRGKRRTYKIHLGSGNILMEPNDQYLCIVPDRSAKNLTADVFLPFEGDAVLSIILSKALLLMEDDKITDETILRQLG